MTRRKKIKKLKKRTRTAIAKLFALNANAIKIESIHSTLDGNGIWSFLKDYSKKVVPRCSVEKGFIKFRKIHRKTPMPESLLYQSCGVRPATLLKKDSDTGVFQ